MPFQHPTGSGRYSTELTLPGYGRLKRTSLRTRSKTEAKALEAAIQKTASIALEKPHLFDLIDELQGRGRGAPGRVSPQDLLRAVHDSRGSWVEVRRRR